MLDIVIRIAIPCSDNQILLAANVSGFTLAVKLHFL